MKILVTGSESQLGNEFKYLESQFNYWEFYFTNRNSLDITNYESVKNVLNSIKPDVVINCAAYTNVEGAESESDKAFLVNDKAVENLALICADEGILLIHFSTDYVFDGTKNLPYTENDITNPLSVYGKSKLTGEQRIKTINPKHFIFRISWLYGTFGKNFYKTMLNAANENREIKVVTNQIASPTYSKTLAFDILTLLKKINDNQITPPYGIYNYTNNGETSWYEFATEILRHRNITPIPVLTTQFPTKAVRPIYSKLDTKLWEEIIGIQMTPWKIALEECIVNSK